MADGNLGSLFVSLGIKDEMSKTIRKIVNEMNGVDEATGKAKKRGEELVRSLNNVNAGNFAKVFKDANKYIEENSKGISSVISMLKSIESKNPNILTEKFLGAKSLNEITSMLNTINVELAKAAQLAKKSDLDGSGNRSNDDTSYWQQRISNALKYVGILQDVNLLQGKIGAIKSDNPNVNTKKLEEARRSVEAFKSDVTKMLSFGGIDSSKVLSGFVDAFGKMSKEVNNILTKFKKENPLSALTGADKIRATMSDIETRYKKIQDLMNEGTKKGFNTSMLDDNLVALKNRLIELDRVLNKDTARMSDTNYMRGLYSNIAADMTLAKNAMSEYGSEKGKVIATEREHQKQMKASAEEEKKNEQTVEEILQRRAKARELAAQKEADAERQRQEQAKISAQIAQENAKSEIRWNEQKAKANSEALQRQMKASAEEEKKRQVSLFSNGFDTTILEKRLAMLNRMKEIQEKLAYYHPKAQYAFLGYESGLKFGNANTPEMRHKEDELQRLRNIIADLDAEFNKLGGNDAFKNVDNQVKNLEQTIARLKESGGQLNLGKMLGLENKSTDEFRIAKEAAMATEAHVKKQNELTASFEKYFRVQGQVEAAEKRLAEATARTNQARREAIAASRQQAESLVRDRVKELEAQRQQLQGLFGSGKNALNTQELMQLQQAFSQITQEINTLRGAMNNLGSYSIKELFSMGRGTSDYSPLVGSMRTVLSQQEEIAKSAAKARNDLAAAFAGANAEAKKMQSIVGDIKSLFLQGGIVFGAQQFFNSIVQTGGEIVQQHVALRSILGDVQKADELFSQTQQLALQSPFKFGELNRDVKQLAAFGVEANDLYDTTKRLADIASGLGVSFERLGLAYGQVKARSWLDGKELRQFAYAGLPLLQKITELYNQEGKNGRNNYTQADVKKMISGRQVSFEDVQKVLWNLTNEGGQFYNMQLVLSETLLGRWNKLIDAWDIMLGKFAEGKSVVGGIFSFIINRVTDLVLALDKLSPAMLSFGAVFAARKLGGLASSKFGLGSLAKNYNDQVNAQLKSYAIEQQQRVVKGEIAAVEGKTAQEIALQNVYKRAAGLADKNSLVASYNRAALEGRMSVLQMQRAVKEGLVSKEIIQQLALMGQITAKQEQIILNGGRISAVWNMTTSKVGGFINALGGWWGIGITAITSLLMGYYQWSSKVKEDAKTMVEGAKQKSQNYGDFLSELGPKSDSNLSSQVDSMKEILKSSDDYTDSIKEQVENAGSLSKQYDILKEKIESAKKVNDGMVNTYGSVVSNATSATGLENDNLFNMLGMDTPKWLQWLNGIGNDDITTNVEEAQESLSKFQLMFDELDSKTKGKMEDFIQSLMKNNQELANQIKGLPLSEQIRMLAAIGGDDWDKFVDKFANGSKETEKWLKELASRAKESSDDVSEIMYDDVPKGLESIRKQLGMSQDHFKKWAKENPEIFASMMDKMAQKANITSKTILYYFHSAISKLMDMNFWPDDDKVNKKSKPVYHSGVNTPFANTIRQRLFKNKTVTGTKKKGKFWAREVDNALGQVQDQSFQTTGENIQKELKSARNELDVMNTGKFDKKSAEYRNAKHKYDMWKAIADAGYISDDLGKNKVTGNFGKDRNKNGGRKEDTELKALQERLSSLKSARQTYQQYKTVMSEQQAKDLVYSLYPNVKGLNLDDYLGSIAKITPSDAWFKKSADRLKFQTSLNREKADWRFSEELKPEFDRIAADFTEALNKGASQFDLYKSLLEKTGSKDFADQAFKEGAIWDDQAKNLAQQFNEMTGLDADITASYATAKHYLVDVKGNQKAYDLWKKIVDLVHGNYTDALKESADIIKEALGYEEQITAVVNKYNDIIDRANETGNKRAAIAATQQRDKAIGEINLKKFKNSEDYLNFYGAIYSLGVKKAQEIAKKIRENLNKSLADGSISAREYGKEIENLQKQLQKLSEVQPSFLHGGLNGVVQGMQNRGSSKMAQGQNMYDVAKRAYDIAEQLGNTGAMQGAQKGMDAGKAMSAGGEQLMQGAGEMEGAIAMIDTIVHGINDMVQGLNDTFQDIKDTADALGHDTTTDDWSDASTFFSSFSNASNSATKGWDSLKEGNISGVVSGVVGSWTGWIKGFSQGHDQKLDNQIKIAERQEKLLKNIYDNTKSVVENTLGGIYNYKASDYTTKNMESVKSDYEKRQRLEYELNGTAGNNAARDSVKGSIIGSAAGPIGAIAGGLVGGIVSIFSDKRKKLKKEINKLPDYGDDTYEQTNKALKSGAAYDAELASLMAQRDMLKKQRDDEAGKKKSDADKIADYDKQIEDMRVEIENFSKDFLKDIYSIDMKSWASELTDAVVGAWEKGEDAADAYKEKVKEMVKDLTKNIISQKIVETAMNKPLEYLTSVLTKKGKLDETDMDKLADQLYNVGEEVVPQIIGVFDALKNRGLDLRENGSSSASNSIKGITEETADILASYLNAVRLDVSVIREMQGKYLPEMSEIAKSQLSQLNLIAQNTLRNADAAERIETIFIEYNNNFNRVLNGTKSLKMK